MLFEGFDDNSSSLLIKAYQHNSPLQSLPMVQSSIQYFDYLKQHDPVHGILNYTTTVVNDTMAFLIRPKFGRNLVDYCTYQTPTLRPVEKLWVSFQIIEAIHNLHLIGFAHCDLKPENVIIRFNGEVLIVDPAPFKPSCIDPQFIPLFYHYFGNNNSGCYLAPERFTSDTENMEKIDLRIADMFSLGCILAFIYLNGDHLFNLISIQDYKKDPTIVNKKLEKIEDENIRKIIMGLISLDLKERAQTFKNAFNLFPVCFKKMYNNFYYPKKHFRPYQDFIKQEEYMRECEYDIGNILIQFYGSKLLRFNHVDHLLYGVDFITNFAKKLDNEIKFTKIIPLFVELLNFDISFLYRTTLFSIIEILQSVDSFPEYLGGFFDTYMKSILRKIKYNDEYGLHFSEFIPEYVLEVQRLDNAHFSSACSIFNNFIFQMKIEHFNSFTQSLLSIAPKGNFEFLNYFLPFFMICFNKETEQYLINVIDILTAFVSSITDENELHLYKTEFQKLAIIILIEKTITKENVSNELISKCLEFINSLFYFKIIQETFKYSIVNQISRFLYHDDPSVRFITNKIFKYFSPVAHSLNLYSFAFSSNQNNFVVKLPNSKTNFSQKYKFSSKKIIESTYKTIEPHFIASCREVSLPINKIVSSSTNDQFLVIENQKKWRIMAINDNYEPIQQRSRICRNQIIDCISLSGNNSFMLCDNEGTIHSVECGTGKMSLFYQNSDFNISTLSPIGNNLFLAGQSNGNISLFDIRESDIIHNYKCALKSISSSCTWPNNIIFGIGFSEGFSLIFDIRMMLPFSSSLVNPVKQILPCSSKSSLSYVINSGRSLSFIEDNANFNDSKTIINSSDLYIMSHKGGIIAIDDYSCSFLDNSNISNSYYLYDSSKDIFQPKKLNNCFVLPTPDYQKPSLHMHHERILSAAQFNDYIITGDSLGFMNFWRISKEK